MGDYLDKARAQHRYGWLCLIAPARFLGLLRRKLRKATQKLVQKELVKDISWFDGRDIEAYLKRLKL